MVVANLNSNNVSVLLDSSRGDGTFSTAVICVVDTQPGTEPHERAQQFS